MSESIIKVHNLSKRYRIGHSQSYDSLRDEITGFFKFGKKQEKEDFWALKDLEFEIKRGESVGIIGRNGAGKSTLLKVLSRITPPTTGRIELIGRVASLLEVGTGFNPELTGRENIFLNGAILGMSRAEIKRKFDEIVAFAEVDKFLDTPVKRYSSGMYMRLAFAVAAHLESEILIVDEVLAVGDAQFQKKCLGKMNDVTKNEGRTILFVSHNLGALESICKTGILLSKGVIASQGKISKVINDYSKSYRTNGASVINNGENDVWVDSIKFMDDSKIEKIKFLSPFRVEIVLESKIEVNAILGLEFTNSAGYVVTTIHSVEIGSGNEDDCEICKIKKGKNMFVLDINNNVFRPGLYQISVSLFSRKLIKNIFRNESVGYLEVTNNGDGIYFDERQQGIFFQGEVRWHR